MSLRSLVVRLFLFFLFLLQLAPGFGDECVESARAELSFNYCPAYDTLRDCNAGAEEEEGYYARTVGPLRSF
jgi:hypothetical protein